MGSNSKASAYRKKKHLRYRALDQYQINPDTYKKALVQVEKAEGAYILPLQKIVPVDIEHKIIAEDSLTRQEFVVLRKSLKDKGFKFSSKGIKALSPKGAGTHEVRVKFKASRLKIHGLAKTAATEAALAVDAVIAKEDKIPDEDVSGPPITEAKHLKKPKEDSIPQENTDGNEVTPV